MLVPICLLALITFGWRYIQISSRRTVKRRSDRQEVILLRALTTNGFQLSSTCECVVRRCAALFERFETDKVCQYLVFFLSSLIEHGGPSPGTNLALKFRIPNLQHTWHHDHELYIIHPLRPKPAAPSKTDNDRKLPLTKSTAIENCARGSLANKSLTANPDKTLIFDAIPYHHKGARRLHELYIVSGPNLRRPLKLILRDRRRRQTPRSRSSPHSPKPTRFEAVQEARWPTKTLSSNFGNGEKTLRTGTVPALLPMCTTHSRLCTTLVFIHSDRHCPSLTQHDAWSRRRRKKSGRKCRCEVW